MDDNHESENSPDDREFTDEQLRAALHHMGQTAREEAFRAGLPVCVLKDGHVVLIYPDGREESVDRPTTNTASGEGR
jgi:hypothetical protein